MTESERQGGAAMRRKLVTISALVLALAALLPATESFAQGTSADLTITMTWVGHGRPHAKVGQFASYDISVTNDGPDTALGAQLFASVSDQFNPVALTCADSRLCSEPGLDLAPGATTTATFVAQACCFGKDEVRDAFAVASVQSSTSDPNPDNNRVMVTTFITGGRQ
jgi:uncharacterized repeat protein (TIGR01451 family)